MLKELCCTAMLLTAGGEPLCPGAAVYREIADDRLYQRCKILCPQRPAMGKRSIRWPKTYGVAEQVIAAENPQLAQGLKADQSLKIGRGNGCRRTGAAFS